MKIRIHCFDSFGIVHIGPPTAAARYGERALSHPSARETLAAQGMRG